MTAVAQDVLPIFILILFGWALVRLKILTAEIGDGLGDFVFKVAVPLNPPDACHCNQCRKQSGHFWAATFAWHRDFQLTRSDTLRWYAASDQAQRGFCGDCGAFLFWQPPCPSYLPLQTPPV